ncbi:MAG: hypothetical protein RL199_2403 [Pseudomonadota bacterium]|jgi:hypothetical protein
MSADHDPRALLSTALEKLLSLESRIEAAEAARHEALVLVDRQREAVRLSRARLEEWRVRATAAEAAAAGAERETASLRREVVRLQEQVGALQDEGSLAGRLAEAEARAARWSREREAWLDRMVALGRLRSGDADGDQLDLGAFIAELRAELVALRRGDERRPLAVGERPPPPDAAALVAGVRPASHDVEGLLAGASLPRAHRTLLAACGADLDSVSATVRLRAVERLTQAGLKLLGPAVARRLATEPDARVRAAMVRHVSLLSSEVVVGALTSLLADEDPRVRAAAVDGLSDHDPGAVIRALADDAASVRRRALGRLPRTSEAVDRLADALHDPDASVRRVALLLLSGRDGEAARAVLEAVTEFEEAPLRELARAALGRPRGDVTEPPLDDDPLGAAVEADLRAALRGGTPEELAGRLGAPLEHIERLSARLVAAGRVVRRGPRLYLP